MAAVRQAFRAAPALPALGSRRKTLGERGPAGALGKRSKLEGLKGRHVHQEMSKMAKKGMTRNKQKELLQGAGFGLTITKQEDSVPHALHIKHPLALQHSGACPLTTGSELLSANGWSNPLSLAECCQQEPGVGEVPSGVISSS